MTGFKKDQDKLQSDRHQLIIQELLRDEDNKYCVDCDAKGPRWASWNIGVFLCIRCAGIHRNLGVHISKVKSVNLDTWTLTQLATMRDMGNSRARAIYEARLPDNFRRPQTDSALEVFIRSKYEQKRYIAQEYVPAKPDVESLLREIQRLEQANKKRHGPNALSLGRPNAVTCKPAVTELPSSAADTQRQVVDLLGLESDSSTPGQVDSMGNMFGSFHSESAVENAAPDPTPVSLSATPQLNQANIPNSGGSLASDLFGLDVTNTPVPPINSPISPTARINESLATKTSKDAILALYQRNQQPTIPSMSFPVSTGIPGSFFGQFPAGGTSEPILNPNSSSAGLHDKPSGELFGDLCSMKSAPKPNEFACFTPSNFIQSPTIQNSSAPTPTFSQFQTNAPMSPNFTAWPDSTTSWSPSAGQDKKSPLQYSPSPTSWTQYPMNTPWNSLSQGQPAAFAGQTNSDFMAPTSYTSGLASPASAAHQAYLSQVQRQLASLQLSGTVNNPQ